MKLYARPASPFVRKVRIMAREIGIIDQIEEIMLGSPEEMIAEMPKYNPLGKIPALILDDGSILYESRVICEYLDTLHDGEKLFPEISDARWQALMLQGLADGIGEAVIIAAMNKYQRPPEFVFQPAIDFQFGKITRGLAELETKLDELNGPLTIGPLSVACAIGYVNFRVPEVEWQNDNPGLATWFESFSERPSMKETFFAMPS